MDAAVPGGQFPPGLGRLLSAELASVGEDIIAAIAAEVPAYARPLEGRFGQGVRIGVAEALRRFLAIVDGAAGDPADAAASRQVYVRLGEGEFRAGRSLDNLLAAYRVGTRVAWRRFAEVARQRGGLDGAGLVTLGETLFVYIDSVCAASAEGYALAQSADASARERLWDRVGELLLSGGDPAAVAELVQAASLPLPERLAAVLVPVPADGQRAPGLPTGCPTTARGADLWLFVNGDDVRGPRLSGQLAGRSAVVGPTVPWQRAAASAERVRLARDALDRGLLPAPVPDGAPLFTDDHLAALLLVRDPDLLADLARRRLAPLAGVPRRSRGRLALTLLHWLTLRGQRGLVAQRLHIHPQTVRYRVLRLRELFGDALDDPDARFELELVLRAGAASGAWADDGGDGRAGGQWADEDLWGDGEARPGDGGARTGDGEAGGRLPHARQRPAGTAGVGTAGTGTAGAGTMRTAGTGTAGTGTAGTGAARMGITGAAGPAVTGPAVTGPAVTGPAVAGITRAPAARDRGAPLSGYG